MADSSAYTKPFQLTKSMTRDVYPAIDPKNPKNKASGKVIIITGAGGGIGYVRLSYSYQCTIGLYVQWT